MKTIETLQQQANTVKLELAALKKLAETTKEEKELKERKKKELTDQITSIVAELNNRILVLKDKSDVISVWELKKAQELLLTIDTISSELNDLQKNIVDDIMNWATDVAEKVGDKVGVRDKDTKTMNWWGKTALFGGIAVGAYKLRDWAFWDDEDEKKDSNWKKDWFWNHGIGKWLKYTVIGVAWFFGIKRLLDYFNKDKQSDATDTPKEQVQARNDYLKENPEEAKKYIALWGNVDQMYSEFNKKERLSWRNDGITLDEGYEKYANQETKDKDTFKAIVPFAVDQEFWSVEKLLSEWWYYGYIREKSGTELLDTVIWFVKSNTKSALLPFLNGLSSFLPFGWQSTEEWIKNRFNSGDSKQREEELQLFFRQYTKIVTYMQDKHTSFRENIAEEKFKSNPWTFSSVEDAMEDEEWMQKNVLNDSEYNAFYKWSLKNSTDILTKKGLFDSKPSSFLSGIIASCDGVRWDILNEDANWIDSLGRLYTDIKKNTISPESKKESQETIDNVTDNINEELDATFTYGAATSLHVALNTEDNNVQEFLKESWLLQFKENLKTTLQDYKKKFADGTITVEEAKEYHRLVNSYFSFKKEIMIWSKSLQNMKSDNVSVPERALQTIKAAGGDLFDATATSMRKFGKWELIEAWLWWTPAVIIWSVWLYIAKQPALAKCLLKFHSLPVYALYKIPTRNAYIRWLYNKLPFWDSMRWLKYRWKIEKLVEDIANKKISLEQARSIYKNPKVRGVINQTKSFDDLIDSEFKKTVAQLDSELKAGKTILSKTNKIEILNKNVDVLAKEIETSTHHVSAETKKIFSTFEREVMEAAKKANIKKWTPAYTALSKKIWASANYGKNPKLLNLIAEHNTSIAKNETNIMKLFNKSSRSEKQKLYSNPVIKSIVDTNGWLEKWKLPGGKWRMISIGLHAVMLWWMWAQDNTDGTKKTLKETSLDVADFGISMVPVAWGVYDMGVAIEWTDLNGNELSTGERRIRWTIWWVSVVLDCFSFGTWWALLKWAVKWWQKIVLKEWVEMIVKEWTEIAVEWWVKTFAKKTLKSTGRDILLWTTAWIVLMPVMWKLQQVSLDDEPKVIPMQKPIITKPTA